MTELKPWQEQFGKVWDELFDQGTVSTGRDRIVAEAVWEAAWNRRSGEEWLDPPRSAVALTILAEAKIKMDKIKRNAASYHILLNEVGGVRDTARLSAEVPLGVDYDTDEGMYGAGLRSIHSYYKKVLDRIIDKHKKAESAEGDYAGRGPLMD